jgi:hypothetical protein
VAGTPTGCTTWMRSSRLGVSWPRPTAGPASRSRERSRTATPRATASRSTWTVSAVSHPRTRARPGAPGSSSSDRSPPIPPRPRPTRGGCGRRPLLGLHGQVLSRRGERQDERDQTGRDPNERRERPPGHEGSSCFAGCSAARGRGKRSGRKCHPFAHRRGVPQPAGPARFLPSVSVQRPSSRTAKRVAAPWRPWSRLLDVRPEERRVGGRLSRTLRMARRAHDPGGSPPPRDLLISDPCSSVSRRCTPASTV